LHPDHKFQGTGIGLAIVKKIITEINGYIEVSSKLGEGSQFKVYIQK
jgi:signal transduction histidine kinase